MISYVHSLVSKRVKVAVFSMAVYILLLSCNRPCFASGAVYGSFAACFLTPVKGSTTPMIARALGTVAANSVLLGERKAKLTHLIVYMYVHVCMICKPEVLFPGSNLFRICSLTCC